MQHGSFSRYYKCFEIQRRLQEKAGACTPRISEPGPNTTLFPSKLPWTCAPRQSKHRRGHTQRVKDEAFEWIKRIWVLFNFLDAGSPCSQQSVELSIQRSMQGNWTTLHESYARTMYAKIINHCSCPRGTMDRGSAKLNELIEKIQCSAYDPSVPIDAACCGAKDVDPERISLPVQAGIVKPEDHLKGSRLRQFLDMPQQVPEECRNSSDPPACHKVSDADWPVLLRKLFSANMITFVKKADVLRDKHKVIKGGLFCVPHKPSSDRLINDRRPANARERRLGWCQLPSGPMLTQLILDPSESIRASGDDLSNYFYLIQHLDAWKHRNAFGKAFRGSLIPEFGLCPNTWYYPAFRVVCMGDTNGVDIAQATHEAILQEAECLKPQHLLVHGNIFPCSNTLEGLYIDDHLAFQVVKKKKFRDRGILEDEKIMQRSREHYKTLGLPRSEKKAFDKEYSFKAWGSAIDSESGRVGSPVEKLRQVEELTIALLQIGYATKKALQKLIGLYIHPFMHRRECMSLFHHVYVYIDSLVENKLTRLPQHIRDELLTAALILPLSSSSVRWAVSPQVAATDASSKGGGRASTLTTTGLAKVLYRFSERRGEYCKLDWVDHPIAPATRMSLAPESLIRTLMKHRWTTTEKLVFRRKEHINLLEMEMLKKEIQDRANSGRGNCRVVNLCDSRVVVGAYAKGRSSSRMLNHRLRCCLAWTLTADLSISNLWVDTHSNPADFPSRGHEIPLLDESLCDPLMESDQVRQVQEFRSPGVQNLLEREARVRSMEVVAQPSPPAVPRIAKKTAGPSQVDPVASGRWTFREVFAGKARMTGAVKKLGALNVDEPIDYKRGKSFYEPHNILNPKCFEFLKKEAKKPRQSWHFGLPCCSFSVLQHSNGGTRRKHKPEGDGSLEREIVGNEILRRTLVLIDILEKSGNKWSLENPDSSYAWWMPGLLEKANNPHVETAVLDQCAYGLRLMGTDNKYGPCKKHTRFIGNIQGLSSLAKTCKCRQPHVHAVGGVRTKAGWKRRSELAGHYPAALAYAYSAIVSEPTQ